jgi:hypothetical protein
MSNDPVDIFAVDPERQAMSKTMNAMFVGQRNAGVSFGTMVADSGQTPNEVARERLSAALNDLEAAERAKDETLVAIANDRVDRCVAESREARTQPRNEDGSFGSFDGGVRGGRQSPPTHSRHQESANALWSQAVRRSREEASERGEEQTVIVG